MSISNITTVHIEVNNNLEVVKVADRGNGYFRIANIQKNNENGELIEVCVTENNIFQAETAGGAATKYYMHNFHLYSLVIESKKENKVQSGKESTKIMCPACWKILNLTVLKMSTVLFYANLEYHHLP